MNHFELWTYIIYNEQTACMYYPKWVVWLVLIQYNIDLLEID